jgi:hypothetical protein
MNKRLMVPGLIVACSCIFVPGARNARSNDGTAHLGTQTLPLHEISAVPDKWYESCLGFGPRPGRGTIPALAPCMRLPKTDTRDARISADG